MWRRVDMKSTVWIFRLHRVILVSRGGGGGRCSNVPQVLISKHKVLRDTSGCWFSQSTSTRFSCYTMPHQAPTLTKDVFCFSSTFLDDFPLKMKYNKQKTKGSQYKKFWEKDRKNTLVGCCIKNKPGRRKKLPGIQQQQKPSIKIFLADNLG